MSFTTRLWDKVENSIVSKIIEHPFILGMADGTLSEDIFRDYIVQDHKYLAVFGRMLSMLAAKSPSLDWCKEFTSGAMTVIAVETVLHGDLMKDWELDEAHVNGVPMQPACMLYTSYMQAVVMTQPFHEGVGAILACYWVYQHVGHHLKRKGSPHEKYQKWIDMYGGDEFDASVQRLLTLVDALESDLTEEQKTAFENHFINTVRFEYMFWDGPYRQEAWPV